MIVVAATLANTGVLAQMSGTYTIGGTNPDFSTLSAAVSALNGNGVNGPVQFLIRDGSYSGTSWIANIGNVAGASSSNRITFRSQSGNKANVTISDGSSNNYIFRFSNAKYITVKDLTLVKTSSSYGRVFDFTSTASNDSVINCTAEAPASTTSSNGMALVYANSHTGSDNVFYNMQFTNGGAFAYIYGSGTSSTSTNMWFINSKFSQVNSGYYGFYSYYTSGLKFLNNEFTRTGSGTYYFSYSYYLNDDFEFSNNTVNISSTSTMYGLMFYYMNYVSLNTTNTPKVMNNTVTMTNTSGSTYPFYTYYGHYVKYAGNTVSVSQSSGYIYGYGPLYYNNGSHADANTLNYTNGSGYVYNYYMAYNGANWPDTFTNNIVNCTATGSGYVYNYLGYYGSTIITDNQYNCSVTTGGLYNYLYYPSGMQFERNKIKATSTSGYIYGVYAYNTSSYSGVHFAHNDIEVNSSTGSVYGIQAYYLSGDVFANNVVTTKTSGSNYTLAAYYNYNSYFKNNTFHSLSTGSTNYIAYIYMGSSSYKTELKNNIFSKSGTSGSGLYSYDNNFKADYNLYYVPGGTLFSSGAYTGSSLQSWRSATQNDMNSLVYNPPYINAAAHDLHINANSPAAWAVNGRAEHDSTIGPDLAGNIRPKTLKDGVPDIGAYEVTPTSTPPNADAIPANPAPNATQVFTFGQDTVATIDWGSSVPSTYTMRQYTGIQAAPIPTGVGRMFFYTAGTPSSWAHSYTPNIYYKDPWLGDVPSESEAVPARSSNNGAWEGYNYSNAQRDIKRNILSTVKALDSVGGFTGVQNGRIGIRCVENPKGIVVSNITAFAADVDWAPVFNPIGYQVVLKQKSEVPSQSEWNNATLPTSNSLALGGLTEDTKYYVYVRSICGVKDTSGYTMDSFTTLITCHTPQVQVSGVNDNRVISYWGAIKTATKYEYLMTASPTPPSYGTDLTKTSVLAPFLDDNTTYYVHVRAHCSTIYDKSAWSSASFTTWKLGVGNVSGEGNGINVFPNPVRDNDVVISIGGVIGRGGVLSIVDMAGRILKVQPITESRVVLSVADLPSGVYIVQYNDDARKEQVRFSK